MRSNKLKRRCPHATADPQVSLSQRKPRRRQARKLPAVHRHPGGSGTDPGRGIAAWPGGIPPVHRPTSACAAGRTAWIVLRVGRAHLPFQGCGGTFTAPRQCVDAHPLSAAGGRGTVGIRPLGTVAGPAARPRSRDCGGDENPPPGLSLVRGLPQRGLPSPCPHGLLQHRSIQRVSHQRGVVTDALGAGTGYFPARPHRDL